MKADPELSGTAELINAPAPAAETQDAPMHRSEPRVNPVHSKDVAHKPVLELSEEPALLPPAEKAAFRPKKELPKQSALGALMREVHKEVRKENEADKVELNAESVVSIWKEFLVENKGKLQPSFMSVAETHIPVLEAEQIVFTDKNNVSLELLQLCKMDILAYYRKRTTSVTASLDFRLQKKEVQKNYKTAKDRLKEMIVDNPAVLKLIEKLDLNEY